MKDSIYWYFSKQPPQGLMSELKFFEIGLRIGEALQAAKISIGSRARTSGRTHPFDSYSGKQTLSFNVQTKNITAFNQKQPARLKPNLTHIIL